MGIGKVNGSYDNPKIQLNSNMTNPLFRGNIFDGRLSSQKNTDSISVKEQLYQSAANLPDDIREKFLEYLENGATEKDFIDLLIKRHEKKQAEFEVAWAEYQESKNNLKLLEKIYNVLEKKCAGSESNCDLSKLAQAEKALNNGRMSSDGLLSKASYLAHRVV